MNSSSLAIVSSVLFPPPHESSTLINRKRVKLQALPGAWINDNDSEDEDEVYMSTVSDTPPRLAIATKEEDIELLKETIAHLRKEKEKLEETNDIIKKSIQVVSRKRMIAQTSYQIKKTKRTVSDPSDTLPNDDDDDAAAAVEEEEEEEDIYIVLPSDFMPTEEDLKAAGFDGWEWISVRI